MPDKLNPINAISRRSVVKGAACSSLVPAIRLGVVDVSRQSAEWLAVDRQIERLSLRWARLEAAVGFDANGAIAMLAEMSAIESRLSGLSDERDSRLAALAASPARNVQEAVDKLAIAARRMAGEGGAEHDLVADALRVMSGLADQLAARTR